MRFATIYVLVQFSFLGGLLQGILASFFKLSSFQHFTLLSLSRPPPPPPFIRTIKNLPTNMKRHSARGVVFNTQKKYITEACLKALQLYFKTSLRFPLEFCKIFQNNLSADAQPAFQKNARNLSKVNKKYIRMRKKIQSQNFEYFAEFVFVFSFDRKYSP